MSRKPIRAFLNICMTVFFLLCVGILFYPWVAEKRNETDQTATIRSYDSHVEYMDSRRKDALLAEAQAYNAQLLFHPETYELDEEALARYLNTFIVGADGEIGYLTIPTINTKLVIYHTAEDEVLQVGVGHLPASSLPVGGKGTHAVLTGHTGLTKAKLFSDVSKLREGDCFYLSVLEDVLTYEVDQRLVVDPWDVDALRIDPEQDYVTLVTCYPYGVNSHRLLVRGRRVPTPIAETEDGGQRFTTYSSEKRVGFSIADYMAMGGLVVSAAGLVTLIWKIYKSRKRRAKT